MKTSPMLKILISIALFFSASTIVFGQEVSDDSVKLENVIKDGDVDYPKKILVNGEFDFKLSKVQSGTFLLSFYKREKKPTVIKIYDITGNLLKQETVIETGSFSKEYNLSYYKPSFFVVEVGSSKYNKTKSIMAE